MVAGAPPAGACGAEEIPLVWSTTGASGPAGPTSLPGVTGLTVVSAFVSNPGRGNPAPSRTVHCPAGQRAVSGGASIVDLNGAPLVGGGNISQTAPLGNPPTGWLAGAGLLTSAGGLQVFAVCANVAPYTEERPAGR
jgi:hypothetical protein